MNSKDYQQLRRIVSQDLGDGKIRMMLSEFTIEQIRGFINNLIAKAIRKRQ